MRVMVFVKASRESEAGVMPTTAELEAMGRFNEELVNAGVMLAGEGLHPTSKGVRVRFSGGKSTVIRGPFEHPEDQVAGFWIWQVDSLDEAIDWIKRSSMQDAEIELRPIFEAEDFGAEYTPELRAQDERLRAQVEQKLRGAPHQPH
ncbi:MAG: YciI family protein [Thiohalomonadaceae bacterium]